MQKPKEIFDNPEKYIDCLLSPDLERLYGQCFDLKEVPNPYKKEKIQETLIECVSAFANSSKEGGLLVLGVNDKTKEVTGTEHLTEAEYNALLGVLGQKLRHQAVQSRVFFDKNKRILLLYVPYEQKNICQTNEAQPKAWKRDGAQCVQFKQEDWEYFRNLKNPGQWEMQPCALYEERFLDKPVLEEFKTAWLAHSDAASDFDLTDLLENAGAITRHQNSWWFTNAGFLFFCTNPQRLFPSAYVRFLKYDTNLQERSDPGNTVNEKEFMGALPTMVRKIRDWVKDSGWFGRYTYRSPDGFGFVYEDEYPPIAIGEAIVNAIVHRDYAVQSVTECYSYKDAFAVHNAGGILQHQINLPSTFELGRIEMRSHPRNPKIVEWFRCMPDEDGRPFVRRLTEGTKRMVKEMRAMSLRPPQCATNGYTCLTFYNNIEERRRRFHAPDLPVKSTDEYLNLFPIPLEADKDYDRSVLLKEILGILKDRLQANGWYIDKYSMNRLTVHRKGDVFSTQYEGIDKICRLFRAYVLQVKSIDGKLYLNIDYKAILKNLLPLSRLQNFFDETMAPICGIVKYQGQWEQCRILSGGKTDSLVYLTDFDLEIWVKNETIVPDLKVREIRTVLASNGFGGLDLDTVLKQAALMTLPNASVERSKWTLFAAGHLAALSPFKFNGYRFSVDAQPVFLFQPVKTPFHAPSLTVFRDIPEPKVYFGNKHQDVRILEGLSKYGAYGAQTSKDITLIPVCTEDERPGMEALILRLQQGRYKYEGSERTFGVKFACPTIYTLSSHQEIEAACFSLLKQHPQWEGDPGLSRIFLVSTPYNHPSDDPSAPYYTIKQYLLEKGLPCQMLDTSTLRNPDWKDMNLALNLTAKCGIVPWVLSERLPEADCFLGMAYTTTDKGNREKMMGFVSVFDEYGKWRFYKGASVFSFDKRREYFAKLVPQTLSELTHLRPNAHIHVHSASRFSRQDEDAIRLSVKELLPLAHISFVWINDTHLFRGYDNANPNGSLSRGTYIKMAQNRFLLSTTGYNPLKKSLGTPNMIDATVYSQEKEIDLKLYAQHLLSLTKLNWASTQALSGEPITTKYASDIVYLTEKFIRRSGDFKLHNVLEKTPWFI